MFAIEVKESENAKETVSNSFSNTQKLESNKSRKSTQFFRVENYLKENMNSSKSIPPQNDDLPTTKLTHEITG